MTRVTAAYRDDPRLPRLIGPGGPFETEEIVVDGVPLRSFVRGPATIVDAFRMSEAHEGLVHVVLGDERWMFGEIRQKSLSLAASLQGNFGVRRGDRVALAMRNLPEFVVGFWAAALLGAIVVPLNAWWTGQELAYAVNDANASVVFADAERLSRLHSIGSVQLVGVRTEDCPVSLDQLTAGAPLDSPASLGPDEPVTILYTSGTTGRPKGALGTNRGTIANILNMGFASARDAALTGRKRGLSGRSASIAAAPLFHVGGIASIVGAAMSGSKIVMMGKWSATEGLALARREGVTSLGGVPAIARQILDCPDLPSLGLSVDTVPLGGASVPSDLPRRALETFGMDVQVFNGYGSTETTSAVVMNIGAEYAQHLDSVGRPNLTADIRVEDAAGRVLATGQVGELCFRSPQVVKGYWNDPVATAAAFTDGWFHTGDLGYVDDEGFVYVVDRLKDVVIRGGENIYCAEVEAVLVEHPAVADVAIVGIAEGTMGERACAVVVPRPGHAVGLADLRTFASERLATFKCPEALYMVDDLPRTVTGKTAKHELRATLLQAGSDVERMWVCP